MDMENLIGETTEYDKKAALEVKKPKSWCKSVSAFANTLGGALIFGMADDGQIVGRCVQPSGLYGAQGQRLWENSERLQGTNQLHRG